MRDLVRIGFAGLTALSVVACGSAAQDIPPTVPTGSAQAVTPASPTPVAAQLAPVAKPAELFAQGRFKNPLAAFDRFTEWLHIPVPWQEALGSRMPALAHVVQIDAPTDVAVTLDPDAFGAPKALFAISLGLKDFELTLSSLREHGFALERISRDVHFVQFGDDEQCLVSRSNGLSPARLVCSDSRKSLDILGPYMARSLPTQELGEQDLFVELQAEPLRRRFGKKAHLLKVGIPVFLREVSLNNARFDSALSDAAHGVVDELLILINELDALRVEATLNPKREVFETIVSLTLKGERSFTARSLIAAATETKPAPELFWKLAQDADSVSYSSAIHEPQRFQAIADNAADLMNGAIEHFALPSTSLKNWVEAYRELVSSKGPSIYASGRLPEQTAGKTPSKAQQEEKLFRDSLGFHVMAIDADAGRFGKLVEVSVQVFNDPALRMFAKNQGAENIQHLPKLEKTKAPKTAPAGTRAFSLKVDGATLGKLTDQPEKFKGLGTLQAHLLLSRQGERTWVALSADADFIATKLKLLQESGPVPAAERRDGLDSFASMPATSAGFLTLDGALASVERSAALSGEHANLDAAQVRLAMPHRGKTPILFRSLATVPGPQVRVGIEIPRAALEDLAAGVVSAATQGGSGF